MTGRTHQRFLALGVFALACGSLIASACSKAAPPAKKDPPVPTGTKGRQGPPAYVVGGFSVDLPPQTLMPGEESFPCFIAPLMRTGPSRVVGAGMVKVGPGMHHGNITARPSTGTMIRPCPEDPGGVVGGEAGDILAGGSVLFGSSTQLNGTEWRTFPDGMGFPIGDDFEIVARMHYLNATGAPVTVTPHYEWYTIDETKVSKLLGPFIWEYKGFSIPPLSTFTGTGKCAILAPEHIVSLMPHMHKLATHFDATFNGGPLDGKAFLDSPGFNPDGVIESYDPAVDLSQQGSTIEPGMGFGWSCSWNNTYTDHTVIEGVGKDEMCMAFGYAWPYEAAYSAVADDSSCIVVAPPYPKGWVPPT